MTMTLEAFIREHEYCGELDTGLENDRVWMTCTCGAAIVRRLEARSGRTPGLAGRRLEGIDDCAWSHPVCCRAPILRRLAITSYARVLEGVNS